MYPQRRRVRKSLTLVLLVTLALMAVGACGAGGEKEARPRPLPQDEKALHPGVYRSEEFKPSLSFRVGEGWATSPPEVSDSLKILRGKTAGVRFMSAHEVYKPGNTLKVVEAPKDLVGWFQHHPYLKTSEPGPIMVGGVKGVEFDVVVAEGLPEDHVSQCGTDCVDVFEQRFGHQVILFEGDKVHFIVLDDVEGETLTIDYGGLATDFDEVAPEAQKVVESVKWGAS
jgi:hypothetical protein